jgi:hypothetical protein
LGLRASRACPRTYCAAASEFDGAGLNASSAWTRVRAALRYGRSGHLDRRNG